MAPSAIHGKYIIILMDISQSLNWLQSNAFVFQEYSFQITLRQQWNDKRLRYQEKLPGFGVQEGIALQF